jgi:uncharacterized membrane protein
MTVIRPALLTVALLAALLISASTGAIAASTVHGYVYEWSTLGLVTNATVQLDSASGTRQQMVTTSGFYSFNLSPGDYVLIARSGSGQDILYARENVSIGQDGDIVLDLILFPLSDLTDLELLDEDVEVTVPEEPADNTLMIVIGGSVFIVALAGALVIGFILLRKKKEEAHLAEPDEEISAPVTVPPASMAGLSDDLKQVVAIIEKNGGRITQLDLRKSLSYSEAKVSLMITDLESRGILRKVKKGRGNVIILNKEDDRK